MSRHTALCSCVLACVHACVRACVSRRTALLVLLAWPRLFVTVTVTVTVTDVDLSTGKRGLLQLH